MEKQTSGVMPQDAPYDLEYLDGEKWVAVPKDKGRVVSDDLQVNGRWYTVELDASFVRGLGRKLELAIAGKRLTVFQPSGNGPYWLALDNQIASLSRHPDLNLFVFGFGAVWSDWLDAPELARRQSEHRLRQHIVETGRPY